MTAGAGRLCTDVSTQVEVIMGAGSVTWFPLLQAVFSTEVEVIIIRAGPITGFPLLQADLPAHVDSLFFCAEVWAGHCGGAVIIAVTIISLDMDTKTVHLGAAPLLSIALYNT